MEKKNHSYNKEPLKLATLGINIPDKRIYINGGDPVIFNDAQENEWAALLHLSMHPGIPMGEDELQKKLSKKTKSDEIGIEQIVDSLNTMLCPKKPHSKEKPESIIKPCEIRLTETMSVRGFSLQARVAIVKL